MYEPFYGFKVKPFALLPQEEFMFLSRQHRTALDLLTYSLEQPRHVLRRVRRHRHRQDHAAALSPEPARTQHLGGHDHRQ